MNFFLKYRTLANLWWQNGFVYRASIFFWRLRQFLSSFMALTVWSVIFSHQQQVLGYNQQSMIGYIFLISIAESIIISTSLHGLANDIYSGTISNILLKPVSLFGYLLSAEFADKLKNLIFTFIEAGILIAIFQPKLPTLTALNVLFFLVVLFIGLAIQFLIQLLLGSIGFWSPETWAPRFLLYTVIHMIAGKLFPLDILPQFLQKILFLTPFPYFGYIQTQIFLGRWQGLSIPLSFVIGLIWIGLLYLLVQNIWKKGLKEYTAVGR